MAWVPSFKKLYQRQEGKMCLIAYVSRTLNPADKNYHLHKLELLALKWAVCDYFKDYLYHAPLFVIDTDNNLFTYFLSTAKLNSTTHRWVAELADHNFSNKYQAGKVNRVSDAPQGCHLTLSSL